MRYLSRLILSLSALIVSIVLLVSGNAFLQSLIGVRLTLAQVPPAVIGRVLVCYSIGFVIGTLYAERIILRVGHIRAFSVFSALVGVAALLYPLAQSMPLWALLRGVGGIGMAGLLIVIESWFSAVATNSNRSTLFAFYQVCFFLSSAGGQLFLGLKLPQEFMPFTLVAVLMVASLVPLALTRMQAPLVEHGDRLSVRELLSEAPTGLWGSLTSGVLIGSFYAMGPVYGTLIGLDVDRLSVFMSSAIVSAMVLAWPLGWLSDRTDRRRLLSIIAVVAAAAAVAAALTTALGLAAQVLSAGLFVGLSAAMYSLSVAITNDRMEATRIVPASATLLLTYGIGSVIGPVLGASAIDLLGARGLFLVNALVLVALVIFGRVRILRSHDIPVEEQQRFVAAMPEVSPVIADLDPRNEAFEQTPPEEVFFDLAGAEPQPMQQPDADDSQEPGVSRH